MTNPVQFKPSFITRQLGKFLPGLANQRLANEMKFHHFSYEAAQFTHKRNTAPQNINPNDFQKQRDRLQLMREAEDLENNFAPAKTINRKYAMYVAPISYHAQTGDPRLDKLVEDYLNDEWFPNCDITGLYDFFKLLEFGVIGKNRGGDYGWAFMRPGLEDGMSEEEALQLPFRVQAVEPDRIGGIYQNVVSDNYVAGMIIGKYGEIEAVRVFRRSLVVSQYTDPVDVPIAQFVHYTDPMRHDMYRGVSMIDAGGTSLRDMYEILDFLKGKIKLASAITALTGGNGATLGNQAMDAYQTLNTPSGQLATQQDIMFGQITHLTQGADFRFYDPGTPGPEVQAALTLLQKLVAMSYNLPYSFALDASALGGVSTRLESEMAKAEFERGQRVLAPCAHKIKNAALLDAMAKGILPMCGDEIFKGRWGYRPHPQPDLGKEAQAAVSLRQNGLLNPMKYWVDDGQDPETVARDMARWHKITEQCAAEVGGDVQEIYGNGPVQPGTQKKEDAIPTTGAPHEGHQFSEGHDVSSEARDDEGKWTDGGDHSKSKVESKKENEGPSGKVNSTQNPGEKISKKEVKYKEYGMSLEPKRTREIIDKYYSRGSEMGEKYDRNLRFYHKAVEYGDEDHAGIGDGDLNEPDEAAFRAGFYGMEKPKWVVACRIGKIGENQRVSKNYRDNILEKGISVLNVLGEKDKTDGSYEIFNPGKKVYVAGWLRGETGSDFEPLLSDAVNVVLPKSFGKYEEAEHRDDQTGEHMKEVTTSKYPWEEAFDQEFQKVFGKNSSRKAALQELILALHYEGKKLPIGQAIAAAYRIEGNGKNRFSKNS